MSNAKVTNTRLEALQSTIAECEQLTTLPKMSEQQRQRFTWLLAKQAMLRDGVQESEINAATIYRLNKEMGITEQQMFQHRVKDPQAVADWHGLLLRDRQFANRVKRGEIRANLAGAQSLTASEGSAGGYFVPYGYDDRQNVLMAKYAVDDIVLPPYCTQFETGSGNPMATPMVNDFVTTGSSPIVFSNGAATIVNENTLGTPQDIITDAVQWASTPNWRSGRLVISWELFEDARFGLAQVAGLVEAVVAKRMSAGQGPAFITGAGLSGGLLPTLPAGTKVTSNSSTLALADFISVYKKLPAAYRRGAAWFMHSDTHVTLYELLNTSSRPATELPRMFMNCPIAVCNSMNAAGAGVPNVAVLAHPDYLQKRVADSHIQRYVEAPGLAENGAVGFEGFQRCDFNVALFDAQFPPCASLQQHS